MDVTRLSTLIFVSFVLVTLGITFWAHRRSSGARDFYAAGGTITAGQNGLAIAGDYLSAATFLGTTAVFFTLGSDGLFYAVGAVAGWPIAMFLVGERLRNLGRYTFADALSFRLGDKPVRTLAAVSTLCLCTCYLIAQVVGAGTLVQILFHIPYTYAVVLVGALMCIYVVFGGMIATTWIQIVKASLLLLTTATMVLLVAHRFGPDPDALLAAASALRSDPQRYLGSGRLVSDPISAVSLALAFTLGPAGLPHVLMRFFTVKNARSARRSLSFATFLIGFVQIMIIVLGYAAAALVPATGISGGANMAAVHLAGALGGPLLLGVVAAVTFATILAVVSGLTLTAASAVSHDLYNHVFRDGTAAESAEIHVSRLAAAVVSVLVMALAILFQRQNVAFLASLPLVIAASVNFPLLVLALHWRGFTTRGAAAGGIAGLILSVGLLLLTRKVWVDVLGHSHELFPYEYPTLFSLGAALVVGYLVSVTDRSARASREREAFSSQLLLSERGP